MSKLSSHSSPVFWTSSAFSIMNEMYEYRLYFPSPIQKLRWFIFLLVSTRQKLIVIKERVICSSLKSSLDPFSIAWSLSKSVFNLQDDLRASNASFAICPVGFNICFFFLLFECSRVPVSRQLVSFRWVVGQEFEWVRSEETLFSLTVFKLSLP